MIQGANMLFLCGVVLSINLSGSTVLKNPPQPENGEVEVFYGGGPRYRKQSCHGGFSIACDSGLIKRIVEFGPRRFTNSFIICVEDPDGLLFGHNDGLRLLNNTGDRANLTGLIWYGYDEKWSPSIVCLPNTVSTAELVITATTEQTSQNITSPVDNSTGIFNDSQDQHVIHEDDETPSGVFGHTAMVAGIASVAGVVVFAPLLFSVLKLLYISTKVDPRPDGLFGNSDNGHTMNENKATKMTTHA